MNRTLAVLGAGALMLATAARAADHTDGPAASRDPAADITDVLAWMSPDAGDVYLAMNLVRNATPASRFSDQVQYVFHTTSQTAYGAPPAAEINVICTFNEDQSIQCWAGDEEYVTGDASTPAGIRSDSGKLRVFAGLRQDPFFFNLRGFQAVGAAVAGAIEGGGLSADAAGCPALDEATASALVTQLQTAPGGGPAVDDFLSLNVLSIVVAVDKAVLAATDHSIIGVWASTNRQ
jgi:hypothetical protein